MNLKKQTGNEYFIVLDDLADSFDYKNKYAIIEYLCDLKEISNFKILILTHNFDFYRTVSNRLNLKGRNAYFAIKNDERLMIKKGEYFGNVFNYWKKQIYTNKSIFIAAIPFVRNLSEYKDGTDENINYDTLTHVLHMKSEDNTSGIKIKKTEEIMLSDITSIFKDVWGIDEARLNYSDEDILSFIMRESDRLKEEIEDESIALENKIVLSIAIRIKAELYMIKRINDDSVVDAIKANQTRELYKNIKFNSTPEDNEIKEMLSEVLLMTSENIHINSFMYEPIIDLSTEHLKRLYEKVSQI